MTTNKVMSGDYVGKFARKNGVKLSDIKKWKVLKSNNLRVGQKIQIYSRNSVSSSSSEKPSSSVSTKVASTNSEIYKVRQGDSLWSISQKFSGVSVDDIKKWNDISGSNLKVGTTLKISK